MQYLLSMLRESSESKATSLGCELVPISLFSCVTQSTVLWLTPVTSVLWSKNDFDSCSAPFQYRRNIDFFKEMFLFIHLVVELYVVCKMHRMWYEIARGEDSMEIALSV